MDLDQDNGTAVRLAIPEGPQLHFLTIPNSW